MGAIRVFLTFLLYIILFTSPIYAANVYTSEEMDVILLGVNETIDVVKDKLYALEDEKDEDISELKDDLKAIKESLDRIEEKVDLNLTFLRKIIQKTENDVTRLSRSFDIDMQEMQGDLETINSFVGGPDLISSNSGYLNLDGEEIIESEDFLDNKKGIGGLTGMFTKEQIKVNPIMTTFILLILIVASIFIYFRFYKDNEDI